MSPACKEVLSLGFWRAGHRRLGVVNPGTLKARKPASLSQDPLAKSTSYLRGQQGSDAVASSGRPYRPNTSSPERVLGPLNHPVASPIPSHHSSPPHAQRPSGELVGLSVCSTVPPRPQRLSRTWSCVPRRALRRRLEVSTTRTAPSGPTRIDLVPRRPLSAG